MKPAIVIPVYNGIAHIADTLDSCVKQPGKNLEIIVVDDFSTDGTVEVVEYFAFRDKRVKLIRHGENLGRSEARNTGILATDADIILINDHDDILMPHRTKTTVTYFEKNPDVDIVYGKFQVIDELGTIIGIQNAEPFNFQRVIDTKFTHIGHSTMAFRRKVFDKVKYTNGDYSKNAIDDWKFQVDAYKAGFKFGFINKVLEQYRFIPKERNETKILELKNACLN